MAALQGYHADVFITSTPSVGVTADTVYNDISANVPGQAALTCWATSLPAQRYLDPSVAATFQTSPDGTTWSSATPDHIEAGFIRWNTPLAAGSHVRIVSGNYFPYAHMGGSNEWTMTPSIVMHDVTEFGNAAKQYKTGLLDTTVSVKRFWFDHTLTDALTGGTLLILALYVNASGQPAGPRYECMAYIKDDAVKSAVAGIIEESVNFQVHAPSGLTNSVWFLSN